ncbi:MAG: tRNA pseudouridine(55) synthase TruB, partial [bacterium]|nr:tRNA pseudouridine(55) synthase TruB [bacterium]
MLKAEPEGILLVNKELNLTSFDIVAKVRRILKCKRVGHAGTLDPLATGLLIILIGRYTKLSNYLTADAKTYQATITFGQSTTTDDAEGEIVAVGDAKNISKENIEEKLKQFLGEQKQVPPLYSAISVNGERSYKRARRDEDFSLPARDIFIHSIKLVSWNNPHAIIEVHSSKGTYIRSI